MEQDKEYWSKIRQAFYKQVKETNWGVADERICKARGRKAKPRAIAEQVLRSKTEFKQIKPTKFFNFH
jgi:hypothetical protein